MAINGSISPTPDNLAWTIPNEKIGSYGSLNGALIMPTERLHDAHNGWLFKVFKGENELGEAVCLIGSDESANIVVAAETGKYAEIVIEFDAVVSRGGIGAKIWSDATNTHGARTEPFVFRIEVYEWIDSAVLTERSIEGKEGGSQGAFTTLRRQENVVFGLSGIATRIGGPQGLAVDDGATHMDITFASPSTQVPANLTLEYEDPGNPGAFHNIWRAEGENQAATLITLDAGRSTSFRFSSAYFHRVGGVNRLKLRVTAGSAMSGSVSMTLLHETDVNSAEVVPRKLLNVSVSAAAQAFSAGLAGATFTEVGLDTPVEWDHITSLSISMKVLETLHNEDSEFALEVPKDMLDYVGVFGSTETLPNNARIPGWYSVGWSANGHASAVNAWSRRPSAAFCYFYTNNSGAPSRLIALKRTGLFLTDILVAAWRYPCIVKHVSCMRRI